MKTSAQTCPLCQRDNQCTRAANPGATDCWCRDQRFPVQLPASPADRCLCRACVEKLLLAEAARR